MYAGWFKPNLVGNPEDRFSGEDAHTVVILNFWPDRSAWANSADPDQIAPLAV